MANLDALETELLKPSVLKEGHLLKLGRSMLTLPKLNYYVLNPAGVYCFKGKQENDVLRSFIPIDEISLSLGTVEEANSQLHCIKITDRRKVHVLACHSMEIRDSWITAILVAVAQRLVYEPNLRRRRIGSSCSSTDSEALCYDKTRCQFTSPFWTNNESSNKRRSKAGRMSVSDIVLQKTSLQARQRKKSLPISFSLEDLTSIYNTEHQRPKITRKRSMHDLTRHFFSFNASKTTAEEELEEQRTVQTSHNQNKTSEKRRWSLFNIASSLGLTPYERGRKQTYSKKQESFHEHESPIICDTKL